MISQNDIAVATTLLHRYISVHKEVFGFSVRKVIPIPFLFKKTDFPYLWSEAEEIGCELERLSQAIESNVLTLERDAVILDYLQALRETVEQLAVILKKLAQKASKTDKYSKDQYQSDMDVYDRLCKSYSKLGQKLNSHLSDQTSVTE